MLSRLKGLKFIPTPPVPSSNKSLLKDFNNFSMLLFRYIMIVISQRTREKLSAHLNVIAKSILKKLIKEQLHYEL